MQSLQKKMNYPIPETVKCRKHLAKYCEGIGLDIGFGGEPIVQSAICFDRATSDVRRAIHKNPGPTHLIGDAALGLRWFVDDQLDYVYSSHVLEDFEDTTKVLVEWLRVVRPGGLLIINCPDEQAYRKAAGDARNRAHAHTDFSLAFVKAILDNIGKTKVVFERFPVAEDSFSFYLVAEKL